MSNINKDMEFSITSTDGTTIKLKASDIDKELGDTELSDALENTKLSEAKKLKIIEKKLVEYINKTKNMGIDKELKKIHMDTYEFLKIITPIKTFNIKLKAKYTRLLRKTTFILTISFVYIILNEILHTLTNKYVYCALIAMLIVNFIELVTHLLIEISAKD